MGTGRRSARGASVHWLRRHAVFIAAVAAGACLRVAVSVAYSPAMVIHDSGGYLSVAGHLVPRPVRPLGYPVFIRLLRTFGESLTVIITTQHLIGLSMAVLVYAFLLRRGLPPWGATLGALPLLLDPMQLLLEQFVLSDILFGLMLLLACLTLLWNHRPPPWATAASGALAACAGLVRGAGTPLLGVFLVAMLCLRLRWRTYVAFLVGAAIPLGVYAYAFYEANGTYALSSAGPRFLYGRIAPVVSCTGLHLPAYETPLCPKEPVGKRPGAQKYIWATWHARMRQLDPPAGMTNMDVVKDFDKRVLRAQPVVYGRAVLPDVVAGFAPDRNYNPRDGLSPGMWVFHPEPWGGHFREFPGLKLGRPLVPRSVAHPLGRLLTGYQRWIYTPGPLLALLLIVSAAAVAGFGRARLSGNRVAVGLLAGAGLAPVLLAAALVGFSWRYQLPLITMLPAAGALAVHSLVRGRAASTAPPPVPLRPLDRAAWRVERLPVPASVRPVLHRSIERGWCQSVIAVVTAALVGGVIALGAVASGWFAAPLAGALGALTFGLVVVILLVGRRRAVRSETPTA